MSSATQQDGERRMRLLLTNDDGIEDYERRLLPLARAFASFADVTVVVSRDDCSGSSHYTSLGARKRVLESVHVETIPESKELGSIDVYAVEGFPADCVFLALRGILRDDPPDVVVSGLNGGPNLGGSWLHSGTVGAARVAAASGFPAVAVSGVDFKSDDDIETIARWLAPLVQRPVVREMGPGRYLTVGIPRGRLDKIQGIRVARRSPPLGVLDFEPVGQVRRPSKAADREQTPKPPKRTIWLMQPPEHPSEPGPDTDVGLYRQDYIVLTPMRADEDDHELIASWSQTLPELPTW